MDSITSNSTVRFTARMFEVLLRQAAFDADGTFALKTLQGQGMVVQQILPRGRVNVRFADSGEISYRSFSLRDLELV